jgi:hypothetical protein
MNGRQEKHHDAFVAGGDAIRFRWTSERGRIVAFTVQFEVLIEGRYRPAARYDSAHGRAHRDTLDWNGRPIRGLKHWLPESMNFNDALTFAERDFKVNAAEYRREFLRRRP